MFKIVILVIFLIPQVSFSSDSSSKKKKPYKLTKAEFKYTLDQAHKGDESFLFKMGMINLRGLVDYDTGEVIRPINYKKAITSFEFAHKYGSKEAGFNLGLIYWKGEGVQANYQKAYDYLRPFQKTDFTKSQWDSLKANLKNSTQSSSKGTNNNSSNKSKAPVKVASVEKETCEDKIKYQTAARIRSLPICSKKVITEIATFHYKDIIFKKLSYEEYDKPITFTGYFNLCDALTQEAIESKINIVSILSKNPYAILADILLNIFKYMKQNQTNIELTNEVNNILHELRKGFSHLKIKIDYHNEGSREYDNVGMKVLGNTKNNNLFHVLAYFLNFRDRETVRYFLLKLKENRVSSFERRAIPFLVKAVGCFGKDKINEANQLEINNEKIDYKTPLAIALDNFKSLDESNYNQCADSNIGSLDKTKEFETLISFYEKLIFNFKYIGKAKLSNPYDYINNYTESIIDKISGNEDFLNRKRNPILFQCLKDERF